ncbi:signal recognition particle-docking protein FtsY [Saccharophagus degradans]|uniref:Signal recognition particle receptor FtsY n=1 Tax=Saccharophagus degradans TaxID=86304 RepID=A0AAW7X7Z4_9GAMM|nr:signal recognition particle-docking protein FtsY [Saccharophagus degradans]MDO6423594.1 signal recognition particle-docking protein FtsY [Saccharophagus degradans]MDO6607734.1 signal recognition particle-docking protein FtsY [Saccharophagus degradans]
MFFRRKKKSQDETAAAKDAVQPAIDENAASATGEQAPAEQPETGAPTVEPSLPNNGEPEPQSEKLGVFARIKRGLSRTSNQFANGLSNLLLGKKAIDDELLEEIETLLLMADVGMDATTDIIEDLTDRVARKQLNDSEALYDALRESLAKLLQQVEVPFDLEQSQAPLPSPYVILVVGVNGVGKTTTIGKLAKRYQNQGKSVMLAAGDTFRAAAVEQLQVWGERNKVPVIAQHSGADSASVIFDAVQSAQARGIDVLIADTAGRLHNKSNLMEELAKVKRVMGKLDNTAPHEVLLVLDAGTGQNAVSQADHFKKAADVTGLVLTKLDGTAKGGIIFALSKKHNIPVRYIGVGEGVDDLQPFDAKKFTEALFSTSD